MLERQYQRLVLAVYGDLIAAWGDINVCGMFSVKRKANPLRLAVLAIAWLALLALAGTACENSTPTVVPATSPPVLAASPEVPSNFDVAAVSTDTGDAANELVVRITASEVLIPDPAVDDVDFVLSNSYDLHREIYSGLVRVVDDPSDPFRPELAAAWDVGDGLRTYTFALKPRLRFSDGSPLTASDFKWSWERALGTGSDRAVYAFGNIVGADEVLGGSRTDLEGVVAVNDETLKVSLSSPDPYWPAKAASPVASVLSKSNVEQWGVDWSRPQTVGYSPASEAGLPVGTGPFALSVLEFGNRYELVPNPYHHGSPPAIDRVVLLGVPEVDTDLSAYDSGELDIVRTYAPELQARRDAGVTDRVVTTTGTWRLAFVAFNPELPPYDDRFFRRALFAARLFIRWYSLTDPGATGYSDGATESVELLAQSSYSDSAAELTLTYHESSSGEFSPWFDALSENWRMVLGVSTRYVPVNDSSHDKLFADGEVEMVFGIAYTTHPSRAATIDRVYGAFTGGSASFAPPEFTARIEEAAVTVDRVEREERYREIGEYLFDEGLVMPFLWGSTDTSYLVQPHIQGFDDPPYGGSRFAGEWSDAR